MNTKVLGWAITVALGGFLFGFDTAVISGAEQAIQSLWGLSDSVLGQTVAMALYGTIIGALFGGKPADRYGRKRVLFWIGLLFLVSAIGSALAPDVYTLMFFRFIGGLGVGASSVVAPMYITEVAPAAHRGKLVATFQFNIVLGIMMAFLSNYVIGAGSSWRLMLGIEAIPAVVFVFMILGVPSSPRWLILKRKDEEAALKVLRQIDPQSAEEQLVEIKRSSKDITSGSIKDFFSGRYRLPILLAFLLALFNQFSGINAVLYYAPRIFGMAGMEESASLLASVGIGAVNLAFTVAGMLLIDRFGRRSLMLIGSIGYIIALGAVAYGFYAGISGWFVPIFLFLFIASHAVGQGAVIWVFISEIFPNEVRAFGNSFGCGTHWVFAALITAVFPPLAAALGPTAIFTFFALCMVGQLLFVLLMMPETKGVSLEDLQAKLAPSSKEKVPSGSLESQVPQQQPIN